MTLDEVERWLTHAIAGVYTANKHRALDMPPIAAWSAALSAMTRHQDVGSPPRSPTRAILIDFLPLERRRVRREGIFS